jgi:hypothetical protein
LGPTCSFSLLLLLPFMPLGLVCYIPPFTLCMEFFWKLSGNLYDRNDIRGVAAALEIVPFPPCNKYLILVFAVTLLMDM